MAIHNRHRQFDLPRFGKFHRVAQQVGDNLAQSGWIPKNTAGNGSRHKTGQLEILKVYRIDKKLRCLLHQLPQIKRDRLESDFAGIDLGKIKNVVNDKKQGVC